MFDSNRISRRSFSVLAASLGLIGSGKAGAGDETAAPFDVALESNVRVGMRDGVRLATDVYRPARGGKAVAARFPVILERTPYGRNITSFRDITAADPKPKTRLEVAAYYVRHGYVVIFQDCRGRHSKGNRPGIGLVFYAASLKTL